MNLTQIPQELKDLDQWVCAHAGDKCPMDARCYASASSSNPDTWSAYEQAAWAVGHGYYDNVGFVFANNGIVGIDIDEGYDSDGILSALAIDIIGKCESYTERSRSGRGFHILVKGKLPFDGRNNLQGVEIYQAKRFFIMTGDVPMYASMRIRQNQGAIDYVLRRYFPEIQKDGNYSAGRKLYSPVWSKPVGGKISLEPTYPPIVSGGRNQSLASLAGALHTTGYTARQILDKLTEVNADVCQPPLPESEVRSIVQSITRYRR